VRDNYSTFIIFTELLKSLLRIEDAKIIPEWSEVEPEIIRYKFIFSVSAPKPRGTRFRN
jgi:hypothetical protein